jgi:hypothetical protein
MPDGPPLRLLWTASRDWADPLLMWNVLNACHRWARDQDRALIVVHGDAPGGDQIAKLFGVLTAGCEHEPHPAGWEDPCRETCRPGHRRVGKSGRDYCPAAGNYRNQRMVTLGADRAAAFIRDRSRGASDCADRAEKAGIPVRRYEA